MSACRCADLPQTLRALLQQNPDKQQPQQHTNRSTHAFPPSSPPLPSFISPPFSFLSLSRAVKKPKGTVSVVPQIKAQTPAGSYNLNNMDPVIMSAHCYEAGAHAMAVCVDKVS